jgi:hypothetical protein
MAGITLAHVASERYRWIRWNARADHKAAVSSVSRGLRTLPGRQEANLPFVRILHLTPSVSPLSGGMGAGTLETQHCGWWVPVSSEAIGLALSQAVTLPAGELREMGGRGRALIEARYLWSFVAERALAVYSWLAGKSIKPDFVILD